VIDAVLRRQRPARIPYAPNLWQWYAHQRNHGLIPPEIAHCRSRLDLYRHLGVDIFSRNIYCNEQQGLLCGLAEAVWDGVEFVEKAHFEGRDRVIERAYHTRRGSLVERLRYVFAQSTMVQEKFLISDDLDGIPALTELVRGRRWRFPSERFAQWRDAVGGDGVVVGGELIGPLKLLHYAANPINTSYLLMDEAEKSGPIAELLALHEAAMTDLARQMAEAGVRVMMAMDNLDTLFHPPSFVERYSASFYEKISRLCHERDGLFFIHACGRQRANLSLIATCGVDGLEGVAFPPLGDVRLDEAMRLSGDRMILTGGISAAEFERLHTRGEIFGYVRDLLSRMRPHAHRFILAASCAEPYTASWASLLHFRDAWWEYGSL
jgi:hypothetical protein